MNTEEFKFVMDFVPQMLWATHADGYSYYFNKGWTDYTGLSQEENIGLGWVQALHPDDYDFTMDAWKKCLVSGDILEVEHRLKRHDGVYRWFLVRGKPMVGSNGQIQKWYGSSTDINDQKKTIHEKNIFLDIVSHELKTPVTSLKAFCEFYYSRFTENKDFHSARIFAKLDAQISKLTVLIGDLLDVTRMEAGKLIFNREVFTLSTVLGEIVYELQRTTRKHRIVISENADCLIFGDQERIGQVLTNFLSNAIKYSPEADEIEVKLFCEKDSVVCTVTDHGIGIHPDRQPNVFDRFFRVAEGNISSYPGLGLGLYISSEIVRRHGGRIWMTSAGEQGSVFCFSLPIVQQEVLSALFVNVTY